MKKTYLLGVLCTYLLAGCGGNTAHHDHDHGHEHESHTHEAHNHDHDHDHDHDHEEESTIDTAENSDNNINE